MEEAEDRKRRAGNLVIYNVPESDCEVIEDRISLDARWCLGLINKWVGVGLEGEDIMKFSRKGKRTQGWQNRPRSILLNLS